uniref:Solute carrier family 40 member n=1 Tax=Physcomitrium patens TaxID=3218 RepID=A0A7I4CQP2_PHYPA|nr:solute carrier family 40 member 3, chloroplastic-like isoform X1 [Physcomitrium patens]XP_024365670.1 solute carrier family 40 member 3, chloroplastic-like isoform X1 [Physcomitrium patens]XP_024365671.1 solute carrier family 40 member 3, chloroplastic-like isoform X1 [Physcomitrium patens]XP_024365672.1 solute carrier family 40 member 3, chloroplastic-like isoform X1 [Physcomitrium patens]|eukprot:XP_024365668.1 solute carrier family 40 member 3, chloroplastic-like isoform X1 [Physcomitrella patens]
MGVNTLLRPTLHTSPRQPKLRLNVAARLRSGAHVGVVIGSQGLKCNSVESLEPGWLHADPKSSFRRSVASPSHRCFFQDHGAEVIQTVSDETVLKPIGTNDYETKQGPLPIEDGTVVEVLLPTMQVQSLEEQEKLAATPAHPEGLYALFGSYFASCFVEHTWRFAWPAVIAVMHHTLLPVAVVSFVSQLVIFAAGPWVGALMDSMPRVDAFKCLCVVQTLSMLTSASVTIYALSGAAPMASTATVLFLQPWFLVLVAASAVERLAGLATGVAFERDWVVLLAGANRPIALANANAILRRVELVCEISGPFIFGILLSQFDPKLCVKWAVVVMIVSLPVLLNLVDSTDRLSKGTLQRPKHANPGDKTKGSTADTHHEEAAEGGLQAVMRGWKEYLAQPVLPASLAYVLLYFNAVLAPGGLMTTYLTQQGVNASLVGLFRGLCALMGFAATFLSATMISKFGVLKAGAASLIFQALVLAMAVTVYLSNPIGPQASLVLFLFLTVISRLGYWAYDMVDAQIFQTAIPATQANLVGTTEVSLASLAELVMLGVAIVANDVKYFGGLAALSMASVVGAAWIYWHWLANPTDDQRRLFPHDPHFDDSNKARQLALQKLVPSSL